jgi:PAS domain S-box-containing protein/putative nucleotidyltransferase with HDIG domain
VELSPVPKVITTSPEGRVLFLNRLFVDSFGYELDELHTVRDWWPRAYPDATYREEVRGQWLRETETAIRERRPIVPIEARVTCKDGSLRHVQFHLAVINEVSVITLIDLTDRKNAEEALRISEEKHRTLFELESDALFLIDNESGEILEANPAAAALYGYTREELVGMNHTQLSAEPSETRRATLNGIMEIPFRRHRKRDGTVFPVEITASHLDWHGRRSHIAAIRDITEHERTKDSLRQSTAQLRRTLSTTVAALATTTELRDPYTAGHQRRVAELACALAGRLSWQDTAFEALRTAALLHDIGKITVPSEILAKPGKLTPMEMALIREHAGVGASIVAEIDFQGPVAEIIHQHHERLDGSGYPRGLNSDEVLREARILAVADVVEAMHSHRPYRPALGMQPALEYISANAGQLFDAEVVDVCAAIVKDGFAFSA